VAEQLTAPVLEGFSQEQREDFDKIAKGAIILLQLSFEEIRKLRRMTLIPGAATRRDAAVMLVERMDLDVLQLRNVLLHMMKET